MTLLVTRSTRIASILGVAAVFAGSTTSIASSGPVDVWLASFAGGFSSGCSLPYSPEGPEDGPYRCAHRAASVTCAAVADTGTATAALKLCRADLTSGETVGAAKVAPGNTWTCENGAGTGTFVYRPSPADPALSMSVHLRVAGNVIKIDGSYSYGAGRIVVVRAVIPAVCASATASSTGYEGTVTPL